MLLTISIGNAQTQLGTGGINGIVEDINNAAIPNAVVTITNRDTGLTRNQTTGESGQYSFPVLPTGFYTITAEAAGFGRVEQNDLQVTVGRNTTPNLILTAGNVSAEITVVDTPTIDTTKTEESSLITRQQINELPINGRRADQFALLTPGVTRDGRFGLLSYRGQSGVFNNFTLEGNDDNQAYFSEARGRTRFTYNISANAIQEFQVNQSNFLPEFGRSAGGGINATLRSGTNQFRVDAFEFFRNQDLQARSPLATIKPKERRDQFGGSFSGPIVKDKLFFFVNYEQQFRNYPLVTEDTGRVLTTGLPANATAAQITAFNRGAADLRGRFPNGAPGNTIPREQDIANIVVKFDYTINDKNTLSVSHNYFNGQGLNAIQSPLVLGNVGRNGSDDVRINSFNARLTTVVSSKIVNEARLQLGRDFEYQFGNQPPPQVFVGNFSFGRANFLERAALPDERKYQFVDNFSYILGQHSLKFGGDIVRTRDKINNPANFGGTYNYASALQYGQDLIASENGQPARNYTSFQQRFGIPGLTFNTNEYAVYAQDQWRAFKNLTINYGLRYDYQELPDPRAANPAIPETQTINEAKDNIGPRIGIAYDINGNGKNVVRGGYGLYYGRTPNGLIFNALTQTGLRVGGGLTGLPDLERTQVQLTLNPTTAGAPTYPNTLAAFPINSNVQPDVFRLDPDFKNPRLQEFNLAFEREIFAGLTASASFQYTKGERLPISFDTNLPTPNFTRTISVDGQNITVPFAAAVTCRVQLVRQPNNTFACPTNQTPAGGVNASRLNPVFGAVNVQRSLGETIYRALFVEVKRRFAQNYQFGLAYTLSKAENLSGNGDGGGGGAEGAFGGAALFNQFDLESNRAPAPTDQRHRFVVNGLYNTPFYKGANQFARALFNGYRVSGVYTAETGRPFSATVQTGQFSFFQDSQVFSPFGGGLLGFGGLSLAPNVPRNSNYGETNLRLDLRVARDIRFGERYAVELIAEGFNIFNRGNFNGFNNILYTGVNPNAANAIITAAINDPIVLTLNPNFGTRTDEGSQPDGTNARRFQLAARFRF